MGLISKLWIEDSIKYNALALRRGPNFDDAQWSLVRSDLGTLEFQEAVRCALRAAGRGPGGPCGPSAHPSV